MKNIKKTMRKNKAFSLVELLIAITIMTIVGGVAVSALGLLFASFTQTDDQITARSEIEFALNELRPQFTNIGLGMPNSRSGGKDSFKKGFAGIGAPASKMPAPVSVDNGGKELLYAWAIPTEVLVMSRHEVSPDTYYPPDYIDDPVLSLDVSPLGKYKFDITNDLNSWVLFPSSRIPLRATNVVTKGLTVTAPAGFRGTLQSYSEVHLLRIAHLYVESDKLMQKILNTGEIKTLATNISKVNFKFDPITRLLTMTITAHGNSAEWREKGRKIEESVTWRIRN